MSVNVDGQMLYSNIRNICVEGQSQSIYYELIVDCILILHFAFIQLANLNLDEFIVNDVDNYYFYTL